MQSFIWLLCSSVFTRIYFFKNYHHNNHQLKEYNIEADCFGLFSIWLSFHFGLYYLLVMGFETIVFLLLRIVYLNGLAIGETEVHSVVM